VIVKKRLLGGGGKEMTFKRRGEGESDDEESGNDTNDLGRDGEGSAPTDSEPTPVAVVETKIIVHDDE